MNMLTENEVLTRNEALFSVNGNIHHLLKIPLSLDLYPIGNMSLPDDFQTHVYAKQNQLMP